MERIKEELILEVTGQRQAEQNDYSKIPVKTTRYVAITMNLNADSYGSKRSASITIPGNAPIGTRFKVTIEQVDDFNEVIIQRASLPPIQDGKLLTAPEPPSVRITPPEDDIPF
jgi:hypothetical protein